MFCGRWMLMLALMMAMEMLHRISVLPLAPTPIRMYALHMIYVQWCEWDN